MLSTLRVHWESLPFWAQCTAVGVPVVFAGYIMSRPRKSPIKTDWKQGMVYLYQFPSLKTIPNLSPFCLKVETWLRMADINYESIETISLRSKETTLPFIELDGKEYADSDLIIRDLTRIFGKQSIQMNLSEEQLGVSRAIEKMLENSTMVSYLCVRYVEKLRETFGQFLKIDKYNTYSFRFWLFFVYPIMGWAIKRVFRIQGMGKHERDDILSIGFEDLRALSSYLGNKKFLMGDTPTKVDACAFSLVGQIIYLPVITPHLGFIESYCSNLIGYCERIKSLYWPDWDDVCEKQIKNTDWKKYQQNT